jgi:uncharacterized protein GlcG (DUF336 family)
MNVSLKQANTIVSAALAAGREHAFMPLTVVVLDAGGHMVSLQREDGSGIMRTDVAGGKAWCTLGMGTSTRMLRDRLSDRPQFVNALSAVSQGRFVPVPGGVLIRDDDGAIIGAVGVSGDTSDKDEFCAIHGIRAAGLSPEPGEPTPGWKDSSL